MFAEIKNAVGVLALQGDYDAHVAKLKTLGIAAKLVRHSEELSGLRGLIIPGGESTTLLTFLQQNQFDKAIINFHARGGVLFGTCAGAILLARNVEPSQYSLKLIPIDVRRNAYGRQLDSAVKQGYFVDDNQACECVFIRAPKITNYTKEVSVIAKCEDEIVCVYENRCLVATFHPELSEDTRLHQYFLSLCKLN